MKCKCMAQLEIFEVPEISFDLPHQMTAHQPAGWSTQIVVITEAVMPQNALLQSGLANYGFYRYIVHLAAEKYDCCTSVLTQTMVCMTHSDSSWFLEFKHCSLIYYLLVLKNRFLFGIALLSAAISDRFR